MRKSILTLIIFAFANSIFAQVDKNLIEAQKKAVLDAIIKTDQNVLKTPTKPKPWLERAIAYLDLASFPDSTVSLKDPKASFKALDYISEAIKLDTRDGEKGAIAKEAEVLITGNNTSKAYSAFMNMAVIKYTNQDYLNSFKYINKAFEISPNDTTTAFWKGAIAVYCNKYSDAKEAFEKYIKYGGSDINAMYTLSQLYILDKEDSKSNKIKSKAIAIYGFIKWEKQENKTDTEPRKAESTEVVKENVSPKEEEKVIIVEQEKEIKKEEEKIITNYPIEPDEVKKIKEKMLEITGFKIEPTKYWTSFVDLRKNYILENKYVTNLYDSYNYGKYLKAKNEGHEIIKYEKPNGKIILIWRDTKEKIIDQEFESANQIGFDTWKINNSNGREGIINNKGEIIIPIEFSSIDVLDGYFDDELIEPQIFKCKTYNYNDYKFTRPFVLKIINRQGKVLASANSETEDIDLSFFVKKNKIYSVFQFKKIESLRESGHEFSICEYGDLPTVRFKGKFNGEFTYQESFFEIYRPKYPLIIPIGIAEYAGQLPSGHELHWSLRFFNLENLEYIKEIPDFVGIDPSRGYDDAFIITIVDTKYLFSVISKELKVLIPPIPYIIKPYSYIPFSNTNIETPYIILDNKNIKDGSNSSEYILTFGLFKIGIGIILKPNYKEIEAISNRYCVVVNLDNTKNIYDIQERKMALSHNFERIGIKMSTEDDLRYSSFKNFTDFVDCIFEGKSERILLPK